MSSNRQNYFIKKYKLQKSRDGNWFLTTRNGKTGKNIEIMITTDPFWSDKDFI